MRGVLLIATAVTVWVSPAIAADERVSLAGYQDFKFGTSEAEVRARIKVIKESKEFGAIKLRSAETVQIDGDVYNVDFEIKDGLLAQISLLRSFSASITECETEFSDMTELWRAKYGAPDQPPGTEAIEDSFTGDAAFTFNDGGKILVIAVYGLGDCDLSADYISTRRSE
jgi:hypothetical protein